MSLAEEVSTAMFFLYISYESSNVTSIPYTGKLTREVPCCLWFKTKESHEQIISGEKKLEQV